MDPKAALRVEIARRRDELASLCSEIVRRPAENPPGDTRLVADHLADLLGSRGIAVQRFEAREGRVSLLATLDSGRPGRRFMFNAHLDTFPADDPTLWRHAPFGGEIDDGRIYGRGVADMRAGLTASLFAMFVLQEMELIERGSLSLMLAADEEVGGWWGTGWVLREHPEVVPDACLIGEPDGPEGVRIGEKGKAQLRLRSRGEPYYAAMAIGDDCIAEMGVALQVVKTIVDLRSEFPADLAGLMPAAMAYSRVAVDEGRGWLLGAPSVNFGVIRGGLKVNMVPRTCEVEVDIRNPIGISPRQIRETVVERLATAGLEGIEVELMEPVFDASYTSPDDPFVRIVRDNVVELSSREPTYSFAFAATDARYLRPLGVPCVIYGPRPYNVAGFDEYVPVDELLLVTQVHAGSALDYLTASGPRSRRRAAGVEA